MKPKLKKNFSNTYMYKLKLFSKLDPRLSLEKKCIRCMSNSITESKLQPRKFELYTGGEYEPYNRFIIIMIF